MTTTMTQPDVFLAHHILLGRLTAILQDTYAEYLLCMSTATLARQDGFPGQAAKYQGIADAHRQTCRRLARCLAVRA